MSDRKISVTSLRKMKAEGVKIACLTAYDAAFARVVSEAGVELLLVGDSLGMVIQGQETTLPVELDDMVYHTRAVARGNCGSLIIADMPFLTYYCAEQAVFAGGQLMKAGAHMVKLEGGSSRLEAVSRLVSEGIPVCGHLGLLPQSVHKLGGYRVQGRSEEDAAQLKADALALEQAGASVLVLECVPAALATEVSQSLEIPTIGIGAGAGCDGQVLVLYDMLGIIDQGRPRFVQDFLAEGGSVKGAVAAYVAAVKEGRFPSKEHSFE